MMKKKGIDFYILMSVLRKYKKTINKSSRLDAPHFYDIHFRSCQNWVVNSLFIMEDANMMRKWILCQTWNEKKRNLLAAIWKYYSWHSLIFLRSYTVQISLLVALWLWKGLSNIFLMLKLCLFNVNMQKNHQYCEL